MAGIVWLASVCAGRRVESLVLCRAVGPFTSRGCESGHSQSIDYARGKAECFISFPVSSKVQLSLTSSSLIIVIPTQTSGGAAKELYSAAPASSARGFGGWNIPMGFNCPTTGLDLLSTAVQGMGRGPSHGYPNGGLLGPTFTRASSHSQSPATSERYAGMGGINAAMFCQQVAAMAATWGAESAKHPPQRGGGTPAILPPGPAASTVPSTTLTDDVTARERILFPGQSPPPKRSRGAPSEAHAREDGDSGRYAGEGSDLTRSVPQVA